MNDKLIFTEFYPERGHSLLFANTYRLLKNRFDVIAVTTSDNTKCNDDNTVKLKLAYYVPNKNKVLDYILFILYSIKIVRSVISVAKRYETHNIICVTYDELALFIMTPFIPKKYNVYIMSHVNIDNFERSRIKHWMFNCIKNRYSHIVQCGFMAEYLKDEFSIKNVLVWPHPLNVIKDTKHLSEINDIDCAGLSYSNDEQVISFFIDLEKRTKVFCNNKLKVVLKSKVSSYDDGYLTIIQGRIPDDDYDDIINRAITILMPFPKSFKLRMSGTLMDSLSNKKIVIANPITVVERCKKEYPDIVYLFNKDTFVEDIIMIKNSIKPNNSFSRFYEFHDDPNLERIMYESLSTSLRHEIVSNHFDF